MKDVNFKVFLVLKYIFSYIVNEVINVYFKLLEMIQEIWFIIKSQGYVGRQRILFFFVLKDDEIVIGFNFIFGI